MRLPATRRSLCVIVVSAIVAAACSVAGWWAVHSALRDASAHVRLRSAVYGLSVVSRLSAWTGAAEVPYARGLGDYLGASGLLYARGVEDGRTVYESDYGGVLGSENDGRVAEGNLVPGIVDVRVGNRRVLEVTLPYDRSIVRGGEATPAQGLIVLGVDAAELDQTARTVTLLATVSGFLAWLAATGLAARLSSRRTLSPMSAGPAAPPPPTPGRLQAGELTLDLDRACLESGGRSVRFTPKQLHILKLLFSEPGRAFSDAEILAAAWGESSYADSRDVKQYVYLIRKRLNGAGLPGDRILSNVSGIGYRVDVEVVDVAVGANVDESSIDDAAAK